MPITVECQCGKKLKAKDEAAGKRAKCPACGSFVSFPELQPNAGLDNDAMPSSSPIPPTGSLEAANSKTSREKVLWVGFAGCLMAVVIGMVVFFNKHQRDSANREVAQMVQAAKDAASHQKYDDAIAQLGQALGIGNATELDEAKRLMPQIEAAKGKYQADRLLASAVAAIERNDTGEAGRLLREYRSNSHATQKDKAKRLADDLEFATSETMLLSHLTQATDEEFDSYAGGGKLARLEEIGNASLRSIASDGLRNIIHKARSQRELMRQRQQEAQRLTEQKRVRDAEMEAKAKVQRILNGEEDGEIVLRYKDGTVKEKGHYRQGQKEGLWIEHIQLYLNEAKSEHKEGESDKEDNLTVGNYVNGKRNGLWVSTKDGKITYSTEYVEGIINGVGISYKPNGQPRSISENMNGRTFGYLWSLPHEGTEEEAKYGQWSEWTGGSLASRFDLGAPPDPVRARLEDAVRRHAEGIKTLINK